MFCPRCVQDVSLDSHSCLHCGYHLEAANQRFGFEDVHLERLTDSCGLLRARQRQSLLKYLDELEHRFPQLIFSVFLGTLPERVNLREFGFWLLNHAAFSEGDPMRPNENGVLLMMDLTSRTMGFTLGYQAERFISDQELYAALNAGQRLILNGDYEGGTRSALKSACRSIARNARLATRDPARFVLRQPRAGKMPGLRPIRGPGTPADRHIHSHQA